MKVVLKANRYPLGPTDTCQFFGLVFWMPIKSDTCLKKGELPGRGVRQRGYSKNSCDAKMTP